MKAKTAEIPVWGIQEIKADENKTGLNGSPTKVVRIFTPPVKGNNAIYSGDCADCAKQLASELSKILK